MRYSPENVRCQSRSLRHIIQLTHCFILILSELNLRKPTKKPTFQICCKLFSARAATQNFTCQHTTAQPYPDQFAAAGKSTQTNSLKQSIAFSVLRSTSQSGTLRRIQLFGARRMGFPNPSATRPARRRGRPHRAIWPFQHKGGANHGNRPQRVKYGLSQRN